jgi:hypothetical protein
MVPSSFDDSDFRFVYMRLNFSLKDALEEGKAVAAIVLCDDFDKLGTQG